jgi:hypothetical protein
MNTYTLYINDVPTQTSHNRLWLINVARQAYPANCRIVDVNGRCVYIQTATHSKEE